MDPSYIASCVYQFRVVVEGTSPLNWRRRLVRSDMPLATFHIRASATALGNASARALVESPVNQVISKRFCTRQQMQ
jgi:hypothetical protein